MYPKVFSRKHHLSIYLRVGAFFISRKPNYPFAGIVCKHEDRRKIINKNAPKEIASEKNAMSSGTNVEPKQEKNTLPQHR